MAPGSIACLVEIAAEPVLPSCESTWKLNGCESGMFTLLIQAQTRDPITDEGMWTVLRRPATPVWTRGVVRPWMALGISG